MHRFGLLGAAVFIVGSLFGAYALSNVFGQAEAAPPDKGGPKTFTLAENVSVPASGDFLSPFVDVAGCHRFMIFLTLPASGPNLEIYVRPSSPENVTYEHVLLAQPFISDTVSFRFPVTNVGVGPPAAVNYVAFDGFFAKLAVSFVNHSANTGSVSASLYCEP